MNTTTISPEDKKQILMSLQLAIDCVENDRVHASWAMATRALDTIKRVAIADAEMQSAQT